MFSPTCLLLLFSTWERWTCIPSVYCYLLSMLKISMCVRQQNDCVEDLYLYFICIFLPPFNMKISTWIIRGSIYWIKFFVHYKFSFLPNFHQDNVKVFSTFEIWNFFCVFYVYIYVFFPSHIETSTWKLYVYIVPRVYPKGSLVIVLVRPSVCPSVRPSLDISETVH